jgi:hypothetical protein
MTIKDESPALATVSEDDDDDVELEQPLKPKSTKKKKKKNKSNITESSDEEGDQGDTTKKKKKKKKKNASGGEDDNDEDVTKPKSIKKNKKKPSGDDYGNETSKPKSMIKNKKTFSIDTVATEDTSVTFQAPPSPPKSPRSAIIKKPAVGGQPQQSFRNSGVGPGRGGGGANQQRPQSMRVTGGRNPGPGGGMSSSMHAPQRPGSMRPSGLNGSMHGSGGRGRGRGPGAGLNGSTHGARGRGGLNGGMSGGRGRATGGLNGGSMHGGRGRGGMNTANSYRAPGKPASILRVSSHGQNQRQQSVRGRGSGAVMVNADGSIRHLTPTTKPLLDRDNSVDSFDIDNDLDDDGFANDADDDDDKNNGGTDGRAGFSAMPGMVIEGISKSLRQIMESSSSSGLGLGGVSSHYPGGGGARPGLNRTMSGYSTRSMLTVDYDNSEENRCMACLRYIRILPSTPNEKPLKRRIRIVTWTALFLDLLAAVVAITTYRGVTLCCGEPMMNMAGEFPWDKAIEVMTYIYIVLILMEVLPVVRDGFPFNLFNPLVGFVITFAVFFGDSIVEAAIMWTIEATTVACECYIYKLKSQAYHDRVSRLEKTERDIKKLRTLKKKVKGQFESGRALNVSTHSMKGGGFIIEDDDLSDGDGNSFHDETDDDEGMSQGTDISKIRETKLYRERRVLRESNALDRRHLRYHLIGVCVNVFLVCLSLLLIVTISKNKGLCIVDMEPPNVFKNDQLERCNKCVDVSGICEICDPDGSSQCYYPYGS